MEIIVKLGIIGEMMAEVNLKEAYIKYLNILNSGCEDDIKKQNIIYYLKRLISLK